MDTQEQTKQSIKEDAVRTYYCYQLGCATYPSGEIIVSAVKPGDMPGLLRIRATSVIEARSYYEITWNNQCSEGLAAEEA